MELGYLCYKTPSGIPQSVSLLQYFCFSTATLNTFNNQPNSGLNENHMNALTAIFTTVKNWHVDYKPNRQTASMRSVKTGGIEQGTGDI